MCITVPPAKSISPALLKNPPPQTQCATGAYTAKTQRTEKIPQVEKRTLSITEPLTIATAIAAKVPWNTTKSKVGILPLTSFTPMSANRKWLRSPIQALPAPKAREYPATIQTMVPVQKAIYDIPIVLSTCLF